MTDGTALTVIGGYLGAGKTTLLNYLLHHSDDLRIALVVNDFGEVNIDAELLASADGETIALANGCICCTLADGLAAVLTDLRDRADSIDHVVIEASGVSDPVKIAHYGQAFGFDLHGIVVVADAEQVQQRALDKYVGDTVISHLRGADLLVLSKTDLVDAAKLSAVRAWLDDLAPGAPIVETQHGQVPATTLLGPFHDDACGERSGAASHESYESWSFTSDAPLERRDVEAFLAQLPADVLRVKGFVCLTDDPDQAYLLQVVGRRSTLTPHHRMRGRGAETRLMLIGLPGGIDGQRFQDSLRGIHKSN